MADGLWPGREIGSPLTGMPAFEYRQAQEIRDIINSKRAANRAKDRESLARLEAFREYWRRKK